MYSGWIITIGDNGEKRIVWGEEAKVDRYKKENLENGDFGGGFTGRTLEEIEAIMVLHDVKTENLISLRCENNYKSNILPEKHPLITWLWIRAVPDGYIPLRV